MEAGNVFRLSFMGGRVRKVRFGQFKVHFIDSRGMQNAVPGVGDLFS